MKLSLRNVAAFIGVVFITYFAWRYGSLAWYSRVVFGGQMSGGAVTAIRFWLSTAAFTVLLFGAAGVLVSFAVRSKKSFLWAALLGFGFGLDALIGAAWRHGALSISPGPLWVIIVVILPVVSSSAAAAIADACRSREAI